MGGFRRCEMGAKPRVPNWALHWVLSRRRWGVNKQVGGGGINQEGQ